MYYIFLQTMAMKSQTDNSQVWNNYYGIKNLIIIFPYMNFLLLLDLLEDKCIIWIIAISTQKTNDFNYSLKCFFLISDCIEYFLNSLTLPSTSTSIM